MTDATIHLTRRVVWAGAVGLVLLGAAVALTWLGLSGGMTRSEVVAPTVQSSSENPPPQPRPSQPGETVITLAPAAIERAGIVVARVTGAADPSPLRVPGVVQPNEYRRVVVTPLVAGRVTRVMAELGQRVRRGQALATVYSPDLAEAHARLRAARAALDAQDREVQRTEKLVAIGAASREELERSHAEHTAHISEVDSARARVELLGGSVTKGQTGAAPESALVQVPAPIDGTVIERTANVGLNVDPGSPVFTVVDLSNVWVIADVYEQDFARVQVGTMASVSAPAFPDLHVAAPVAYIDPQVALATRTARIRIELPNPGERLRLGSYVDVELTAPRSEGQQAAAGVVTIPKAAVQTVGDQSMVYVASADAAGEFVERQVKLGRVAGREIQVLSGLSAGDSIVVEGSFFLRAEAERLGLRQTAGASGRAGGPASMAGMPDGRDQPATVVVTVTDKGFEPSRVSVQAGQPARITFRRTTDDTCATEVVFPSLKMRRALPLNEDVEIELTPAAGEIAFVCGMDMLRGTVVVQ